MTIEKYHKLNNDFIQAMQQLEKFYAEVLRELELEKNIPPEAVHEAIIKVEESKRKFHELRELSL